MGALDPVREPRGRPGHVGHWSRYVRTFWSRLVGQTGTNGPGSWPTTIGPGWWPEPGPKAFGPGSCHEPGPIVLRIYTLAHEQSTPVLCFSGPARGGVCGALAPLLCT